MLSRFLDQPLFININQLADKASSAWDWLKGKRQEFKSIANPPDNQLSFGEKMRGLGTELQQGIFDPLKRAEEKIGQYEVPFLPETSPFRYLPGRLGEETGKGLLPQNIAEAGMFAVPLGTIGKAVSKLPVGKTVAKVATKELGEVAPRIFKGFTDLSTKVLEKLKGRTTVSKQFISDLTNAPDLKQVERDLIRNVLDSYGGKAEKGIIPSEEMITLYHGTSPEKAAMIRKSGFIGGKIEREIFLSKNKEVAKEYGPEIFEVNVPKSKIKEVNFGQLEEVYGQGKLTADELAEIARNAEYVYGEPGEKLILKTQLLKGVKEVDQIPVAEFAEKVKSELLPLKIKLSSHYEDYNYLPDELKGNIANAKSHIWESPISTSAGEKHGFKTQNYFGHTRIEDMATDIPKTQGMSDAQLFKAMREGKINDLRYGKKIGDTRRVIELQSDLYQKGALEKEYGLAYSRMPNRGSMTSKEITLKGKEQLGKLEQYNDPTAHFRMVREEVKQAAIDGKTKLQFPTGETAMKIEGLGELTRFYHIGINADRPVLANQLREGLQVHLGQGQDFIVTDVLGEGKFKAVPKSLLERYSEKEIQQFLKGIKPDTFYGTEQQWKSALGTSKETFDISGKVDTSNPIFRFYEKDLGSYLRNKFGAKQITDNKGVSWWELDIKPEQGKMPIEAFGALPLFIPQKDEDKQRIQFLNK